jgi:hypothetical protein
VLRPALRTAEQVALIVLPWATTIQQQEVENRS